MRRLAIYSFAVGVTVAAVPAPGTALRGGGPPAIDASESARIDPPVLAQFPRLPRPPIPSVPHPPAPAPPHPPVPAPWVPTAPTPPHAKTAKPKASRHRARSKHSTPGLPRPPGR